MKTNTQPFDSNACRWLEELLFERFGQKFLLRYEQPSTIVVRCADFPNGAILFDTLQDEFWIAGSEPPCSEWGPEAEGWTAAIRGVLSAPGAGRLPEPLIERNAAGFSIHYDILGMTYWMLTRLEEIGRTDLDSYGRFPASSSHAFKHGYLERPIVDEWLAILGQVMKCTWPGVKLKRHEFTIKVSHDVDTPSKYGFSGPARTLRLIGGDLLKRTDFPAAVRRFRLSLAGRRVLHAEDPFNTFDWLMDTSESMGLKSAFYFICGRTDAKFDARYDPEDMAIRRLLRRIHERGHELGLHASFNTYLRPDLIASEAERLKRVCREEGVEQSEWGGRMHYLRWESPITLRGWAQANMTYDSSLTYADIPGFRCGTCFEYPGYDPIEGCALNVRVRPLVAMEASVISENYLGVGTGERALKVFEDLKSACRSVNGCFTLLWHNSQLSTAAERELYTKVLKYEC